MGFNLSSCNVRDTIGSAFVFFGIPSVRSSRREDLMKLVDVRPSIRPSVNNYFYLLRYYVADLVESLQNDTEHWCAQSLSPWFCDFLQGGAVGFRILKFSVSISSLITWPTMLKLCRMVRKVAQSLIWRYLRAGAVGARLLIYSNRFTAYSFYLIEPKFCNMILGISPHSHLQPDFSISFHGKLWGLAFWNLQIDLQPTVFNRLN